MNVKLGHVKLGRWLVLLSIIGCDGERAAPHPVEDGGIPFTVAGAGPDTGGAGGQGGANEGGSVPQGGSGTIVFQDCGCDVRTFDPLNAECFDCVEEAQNVVTDPCFVIHDDCLVDPECLAAEQRINLNCPSSPTNECVQEQLFGTPRASLERYFAYVNCLCAACPACEIPSGEGGAGGAGGAGGEGGAGGQGSGLTPTCEVEFEG